MDKTQANNKGQEDASNGKYERPHSHAEEVCAFGDHLKHVHENNQAYDNAHRTTTEQKK